MARGQSNERMSGGENIFFDSLEQNLSRNLSVGHLNIRSMNTGFEEFSFYMSQYCFDIFALTETWLDVNSESNRFALPNYKFIRQDRLGRGGGIALYIKNSLKFSQLTLNSNNLEIMGISFQIKKRSFAFVSIYRPPSSSILNFLEDLENILGE